MDCPSDISVITSISALPGQPAAARDTADLLAARLGGFSVSVSSEAPDVVPAAEVVPRAAAADSARVTLPPVHLRAMVRDRLRAHPYTQAGDSGSHLASLAATLAEDFKTNFPDVLGQLEDLRLAEWSDQAPPPPSLPPLPPAPRPGPPPPP